MLAARRALWWGGFAAWALFLFCYGTFGRPSAGPRVPHMDKIVHFTYFGAGAAAVAIALALGAGAARGTHFVRTLVVFALVGAGDEFYQSFFPHRSGNDLGDFAADVIGAAAGWLVGRYLFRRYFAVPAPSRLTGDAPAHHIPR